MNIIHGGIAMSHLPTVFILFGVILLLISKVRLGNRDGNYVDSIIQENKSNEEKEKDTRLASKFMILGIALLFIGGLLLIIY